MLLLAASFVVPWTVRARGQATVEPVLKAWVRAPEEARIQEVMVVEGQRVRAGQPLARLGTDELDLSLARARATVGALEHEVGAARGRTERLRAAELALESRRRELDALRERAARLVLTAPFDAVVATPHTELLSGAGVETGEAVLELWAPAPLRLMVRLDQRDIADVQTGDAVSARFGAWPGTDFEGIVESVRTAGGGGVVEVAASVEDRGGMLRPGMRGGAKVEARRVSVAEAVVRSARRMLRVDWLL